MKIQNNITNPNFQAGLTSAMRREILDTDTKRCALILKNYGIKADFKNNQFVAWCAMKSVNIINDLNRRFGLKLALPEVIKVEDFKRTGRAPAGALGCFKNVKPESDNAGVKLVSGRAIYFNEFKDCTDKVGANGYWSGIDKTAEKLYEQGSSTTDFFLEPVFHEFAHCIFAGNLVDKFSWENVVRYLIELSKSKNVEAFQERYGKCMSGISQKATTSPIEALVSDLTKRFMLGIDKTTLLPKKNILSKTPYVKRGFMSKIFFHEEKKSDMIVRKIWNGEYHKDMKF